MIEELKPTETIKIPWALFVDLINYFIGNETDPQTTKRIEQGIREKAQAIVKHQQYTENKKTPS